MSRSLMIPPALMILLAGCSEDVLPTAPRNDAVQAITASMSSSDADITSSICAVNRRALSDLQGQVQENPDSDSLRDEVAAQTAITADVCS